MKSKRVAVVGSINADLVFRCQRFPKPGETLLGGTFSTFLGGKGANQAVAAARFGAETYMVGCVGNDTIGHQMKDELSAYGVNTDFVHFVEDLSTTTAVILVNQEGENSILVSDGANGKLSPEWVKDALASIQPDVILLQLEVPLEANLAAVHSKLHALVFLDPAPTAEIPSELLMAVDLMKPNEHEAAYYTEGSKEDPVEAARRLVAMGCRQVVVTLGAKGCVWVTVHSETAFNAPKVEPVDTTAAGDTFAGSLAAQVASGSSIGQAIPIALAAASLSTTVPGAAPSCPTKAEVEAFMGSAFRLT